MFIINIKNGYKMTVSVANIESILPPKLILDRSNPQNPVIPTFSRKTFDHFTKLYGNQEISNLNYSSWYIDPQVTTLDRLMGELKTCEEYETLAKVASVIGTALAVALFAGGIIGMVFAGGSVGIFVASTVAMALGVPALIFTPCGIAGSFTMVDDAELALSKQVNSSGPYFLAYQLSLQRFLLNHEQILRTKLNETIVEKQGEISSLVGFQATREANEIEIIELREAIAQLDKFMALYSEKETI